jgi:hypothetical protein
MHRCIKQEVEVCPLTGEEKVFPGAFEGFNLIQFFCTIE